MTSNCSTPGASPSLMPRGDSFASFHFLCILCPSAFNPQPNNESRDSPPASAYCKHEHAFSLIFQTPAATACTSLETRYTNTTYTIHDTIQLGWISGTWGRLVLEGTLLHASRSSKLLRDSLHERTASGWYLFRNRGVWGLQFSEAGCGGVAELLCFCISIRPGLA
jgi:hypothetical protein